ncbi:MAG: hypothetical protein HY681_14540 [Chloroflexi bacterium]|nr:hypothetical protein [Chloroflexota bacterium]
MRIYVPVQAADIQAPPIPASEGSELLVWGYDPADTLTVISSPRSGTERLTEIGGYVVVEPGTNVTVPISYSLPPGIVRQIGQNTYEYRLLVQRQPGAPNEPVDVFLKLPEGGAMVSSSPAPAAADGDWLRYTLTLDADQLITLQYRAG